MSSDGRYHSLGCNNKTKGHSDGKWCWTEADVESLEKQYREQKTWNQIGDSFKFYDAKGNRVCYRHHSFACQAKMNAILLVDSGRADSKGLVNLGKRPRAAKKPVDNTKELGEKHENTGVEEDSDEADDQDEKDDKEAEEAIKKVFIKIESDSE